MKNEVYGLVSKTQLHTGEILNDGTLLFATREKADYFLEFVKTTAIPEMKESRKAIYEHDQSYVVTNFIAECVQRQGNFFVSDIKKYLLSSVNQPLTQGASISSIVFVEEEEEEEEPVVDSNDENIIESDGSENK